MRAASRAWSCVVACSPCRYLRVSPAPAPDARRFTDLAAELSGRVDLEQSITSVRARRNDESRVVPPVNAAARRAAVDDLWGDGLPAAQKLALFDRFWGDVDRFFAAFQGIDVDWAAVRQRYRREIEGGVSAGRFAAIMTALSLPLRESHTMAIDLAVSARTWPEPGVPLFVQGGWFQDYSGACVTAADDGSALVYRAARSHPLGLEPGDRILGYDGRPWNELYRELIDEELPMSPQWWGSSPAAFEHSMTMSAGNNWHLFGTIDVAKATGEVEHLSTALLDQIAAFPFCSEQLPIAGVPMPVYGRSWVTWGIVEGTSTGYIYVWGWTGDAGVQFERAVRELTESRDTDGLILDFRFNVGGNMFLSNAALAQLFDQPVATIGFDERAAGRRPPEDVARSLSESVCHPECRASCALRQADCGVDGTGSGQFGRPGRVAYDLSPAQPVVW